MLLSFLAYIVGLCGLFAAPHRPDFIQQQHPCTLRITRVHKTVSQCPPSRFSSALLHQHNRAPIKNPINSVLDAVAECCVLCPRRTAPHVGPGIVLAIFVIVHHHQQHQSKHRPSVAFGGDDGGATQYAQTTTAR